MDQGRVTGAVFVDFRCLYDRPSYVILFEVQALGINGIELAWFVDYMSDRQQSVHYQNTLSDSSIIPSGGP